MTHWKSQQLSKIVTHYINTHTKASHLDQLIESFNTGKPTSMVTIEDLGSLGKGHNVNGHGCYVPVDGGRVLFIKNV
jgi:hypothetical protein